ncbi:MAG: hypothetical protein IPN96_07135 [Anaerolineales bacterium]|nr:hypothetical protein [Anaerolineales bacterium]
MPIDLIVTELSKLIIPALPYLLKGIKLSGQKAAEKLGEASAGKSMELAQSVWNKLTGKKAGSDKLSIAAKELSKTPKDKDWQGMLNKEIKQLLKADPALLREITLLLKTEAPEQIISAKRNVNTKAYQSNIGTKAKQKIVAEDNRGLDVRQSVKK